ncbi:hypothetical protein Back2_15060 [Nocardioides baekrokdamisoli]|uniref:Uncharacterized protein n=1 Tax=Nocardioides baekrokdamisoli TaxID=1804624 RepID=A0A3G9J2J4_9ACTN|nr:hypothetical protein [Nocardioides baekrokdamisoli]BBH17219.1 hypothetical protein Back2_15060 [Nocardioides baekrokdamisoli]
MFAAAGDEEAVVATGEGVLATATEELLAAVELDPPQPASARQPMAAAVIVIAISRQLVRMLFSLFVGWI